VSFKHEFINFQLIAYRKFSNGTGAKPLPRSRPHDRVHILDWRLRLSCWRLTWT